MEINCFVQPPHFTHDEAVAQKLPVACPKSLVLVFLYFQVALFIVLLICV